MTVEYIKSEEAFEQLKSENEAGYKYLRHDYHRPDAIFPCLVEYTFDDLYNGPYTYAYEFYQLDDLGLKEENE